MVKIIVLLLKKGIFMHILGNYNKLAGLFLLAILIFAGNVTLFADLAKSQDNYNIESIYFNHDNTITVICKDRRNICYYRDEFYEKFNSLCKLDEMVMVGNSRPFFN